jgi:rod shape-determining protein MreC
VKRKRLLRWLILIIILVAFLNLPGSAARIGKIALRESVSPLQSIVFNLISRMRESVIVLRGLGGAMLENRKMAAELVLLRGRLRELESVKLENIELRKYLNFARYSSRNLTPCEVIGRDPSGWWQTIRLGSGYKKGISEDCAVETLDGLIGKTVNVSPQSSEVLLISDPACRISVNISGSGAFGVLKGQGVQWGGGAVCRMDFINKDKLVRVGDEVVTSGMGGVFPKGLLVGYVEKVYTDRSGLYQYADVLPKADLGWLTYVFVAQ